MTQRNYFKTGSQVTATSLTGHKIIGIYRGACAGPGVWLYGSPENSQEPNSLHKCSRLTLALLRSPQALPRLSTLKLETGDWCTGETSDKELIVGYFMQTAGPRFAYIRGRLAKDGSAAFQAIKVKRSSLKKQA